LDSALLGHHTTALYNYLDRESAAILAQLRTGHGRLNEYLYRISQRDSDLCAWGIEPESVSHFLIRCTRWSEQRFTLIEKIGPSYRSVSLMLGGKPEGISVTGEDDTKVWKSDIKAVKAVIAFASETGGPRTMTAERNSLMGRTFVWSQTKLVYI
jgi:hypothetical protein